MTSPSRIRRRGREAFFRGGDPELINPYAPDSYDRRAWTEGWEQSKRDDDILIANEAQAELDDFDKVQEFARLYNLAKEQGLIT
jgi:hypothetical protein